MPTDPLGLSFSPFGQGSGDPTRPPGGSAATPQDAIQVLSFRAPRTVGAQSPIPGALLNAPGGSAFGGGGNLDQLLALLFGNRRLMGGVSGLPEPPQGMSGPSPFGGASDPLPWEQAASKAPAARVRPGVGDPPGEAQSAPPFAGGTAGPGPFTPMGQDRPFGNRGKF